VPYETYEDFELTAKLKNSFVHGTELKKVSIFETKWFGTAPFFFSVLTVFCRFMMASWRT